MSTKRKWPDSAFTQEASCAQSPEGDVDGPFLHADALLPSNSPALCSTELDQRMDIFDVNMEEATASYLLNFGKSECRHLQQQVEGPPLGSCKTQGSIASMLDQWRTEEDENLDRACMAPHQQLQGQSSSSGTAPVDAAQPSSGKHQRSGSGSSPYSTATWDSAWQPAAGTAYAQSSASAQMQDGNNSDLPLQCQPATASGKDRSTPSTDTSFESMLHPSKPAASSHHGIFSAPPPLNLPHAQPLNSSDHTSPNVTPTSCRGQSYPLEAPNTEPAAPSMMPAMPGTHDTKLQQHSSSVQLQHAQVQRPPPCLSTGKMDTTGRSLPTPNTETVKRTRQLLEQLLGSASQLAQEPGGGRALQELMAELHGVTGAVMRQRPKQEPLAGLPPQPQASNSSVHTQHWAALEHDLHCDDHHTVPGTPGDTCVSGVTGGAQLPEPTPSSWLAALEKPRQASTLGGREPPKTTWPPSGQCTSGCSVQPPADMNTADRRRPTEIADKADAGRQEGSGATADAGQMDSSACHGWGVESLASSPPLLHSTPSIPLAGSLSKAASNNLDMWYTPMEQHANQLQAGSDSGCAPPVRANSTPTPGTTAWANVSERPVSMDSCMSALQAPRPPAMTGSPDMSSVPLATARSAPVGLPLMRTSELGIGLQKCMQQQTGQAAAQPQMLRLDAAGSTLVQLAVQWLPQAVAQSGQPDQPAAKSLNLADSKPAVPDLGNLSMEQRLAFVAAAVSKGMPALHKLPPAIPPAHAASSPPPVHSLAPPNSAVQPAGVSSFSASRHLPPLADIVPAGAPVMPSLSSTYRLQQGPDGVVTMTPAGALPEGNHLQTPTSPQPTRPGPMMQQPLPQTRLPHTPASERPPAWMLPQSGPQPPLRDVREEFGFGQRQTAPEQHPFRLSPMQAEPIVPPPEVRDAAPARRLIHQQLGQIGGKPTKIVLVSPPGSGAGPSYNGPLETNLLQHPPPRLSPQLQQQHSIRLSVCNGIQQNGHLSMLPEAPPRRQQEGYGPMSSAAVQSGEFGMSALAPPRHLHHDGRASVFGGPHDMEHEMRQMRQHQHSRQSYHDQGIVMQHATDGSRQAEGVSSVEYSLDPESLAVVQQLISALSNNKRQRQA